VERVLDFAAVRLKPGGILSVSYNALPGWAAVEPLRRLMHDLSADVKGSSVDRARHAMAMAKLFLDAGAEYFGSNPAAREMMETMQASGATYAAHEYFGAEWHPMYFADVAAKMKPRALRFAGQLPLYLNFRDLVIPTGTRDVFGAMTDRLAFEGLKDFAINEFFRRDVFVKEGSRDEADTRQYLETTPFGTTVPEDKIKRTVQLRHHALRFEGPVYDALVPRLAGRAATVPELLSEPTFARLDPRVVKDAVLRLLLGEQVSPMRAGRHEAAVRYNRSVLERLVPSATRPVLASPVGGTGVPVSMLDAVALRALTLSTPAARDAWLRDLVTRRPIRLVHGDRIVTDADEQLRAILAHLQTFGGASVTKLVELGVLEPAAGSPSPSA
jgi:Predicted methyltransferase regulatory domain